MRWLSKYILHSILGWEITGFKDWDNVKKAVLIAIPHTSWHDFYIGVLIRSVIRVKVSYIAKKALFKWPYGWFFRITGGIPVERKHNENQVEAIARLFSEREIFRIALAPEGTRKKVKKWRTGFYYIAKEANVPIVMFTLDYENKKSHFSEPFFPTDVIENDFKFMETFYKGVKGKVPEYS